VRLWGSIDAAPAALTTLTATVGKPGAVGGSVGVLHCTAFGVNTTTPPHTSSPIITVGGVSVASIKPPVPVITTGKPTAAMMVGVTDASTGRLATVAQASQVTGPYDLSTHATDTLTVLCSVARSVAMLGLLASHPRHVATSGRPGVQATAAHGTPATDTAAS